MKRYPYSVSKDLRWAVFIRDEGCVLAKLEPDHRCFDVWHQEHASNDFDRLTLEHVHRDGSMMGKRAPSDMEHMVALCGFVNNQPPTKVQRTLFRMHLDRVQKVPA